MVRIHVFHVLQDHITQVAMKAMMVGHANGWPCRWLADSLALAFTPSTSKHLCRVAQTHKYIHTELKCLKKTGHLLFTTNIFMHYFLHPVT